MNLKKILDPVRVIKKLYLLLTDQALIIDTKSLAAMQREDDIKDHIDKPGNKKNQSQERQRMFDDIQNMRPPVFIFGPPRSGSTYLVEALNLHEKIFITNELRVMSFINDLFRLFLKSNRMEWNLTNSFKNPFLQHFRGEMTDLVKRFYLKHLPTPNAVWGDKHPHYSDPAMDPGALDTILELFPEAKFIHIYRNPREQIHSVTTKGWKDFKYAVLAYRRIVTVGRKLGNKVGSSRYLEIKYENLCNYGEDVANEICSFLDIAPSQTLIDFMRQQEETRTPFSSPITNENEIGKPKAISFSPEEEAFFEKILGRLAMQLGYE